MLFQCPTVDWSRFRDANDATNGFPAKIPTVTNPYTAVAVDSPGNAPKGVIHGIGDNLEILPYGAGVATNTFSMRIIGWRKISTLWIPSVICELLCTLGTRTGVAGQLVTATDLFVEAISITQGAENVVIATVPAACPGRAIVNIAGYEFIEFSSTTGGSATNANCLYGKY